MEKTLTISEKNWKRLTQKKLDGMHKSIDEVITYLFEVEQYVISKTTWKKTQ